MSLWDDCSHGRVAGLDSAGNDLRFPASSLKSEHSFLGVNAEWPMEMLLVGAMKLSGVRRRYANAGTRRV